MKNHHSFIFLIVLLTGCSSYSSLSSFSSRKYTKGYFFDAPAEKPAVTAREGANSLVQREVKKGETQYNKVLANPTPITSIVPAKRNELKPKLELKTLVTNSINSQTQQKNAPAIETENTPSKAISGTDIAFLFVIVSIMTVGLLLVFQLLPSWWAVMVFFLYILLMMVGSLFGSKKQAPTRLDYFFFSLPVTSFFVAIFSSIYFLAIPKYLNNSQKLIPGFFLTFHLESLLSFYLLIAEVIFLAIKALLKPDTKYKGWAWAALAISAVLLVLSFVLHYV